MGLSTGITVLVARKIGEKRPDEAGKAIHKEFKNLYSKSLDNNG